MSTEPPRDASGDDAALTAAWRAASQDEPPASVDAAIVAAARAELRRDGGARPARRPWWSTWQPLAAAAGVAGLAFVLVQTLPEHAAPRAPAVSRQSTAADSGPPREESAAVRTEPATAAKSTPPPPAPVPVPSGESRAAAAAPAPPSAAAAPQDATVATDTAAQAAAPAFAAPARGATADRPAARAVAEREAAAALSREDRAVHAGEPPSPEGWVARIVASYEAGDRRGAEAQLEAFRQAYPDADRHLPDELRDWAASVPMPAGDGPP